jgi:hypothetical protein
MQSKPFPVWVMIAVMIALSAASFGGGRTLHTLLTTG